MRLSSLYRLIVLACATVLPLVASAQIENHDIRVGNTAYRSKNYAVAEKKYRSALSKKESSYYANFNLGNALYRKGEWQTARNYYQKAVAYAPSVRLKAEALHNMGTTYLQEKKYKEAVDFLKKSMLANPNSNETRKLLAYAMRMDKRYKNQNPPPNTGDKKMEDDSQDNNRKILETLDEDEENRKPNSGAKSMVKNW
ncbi:MAG: tetratricopeptide repeat protein [Paludibacteraceae bacterium]|nr:tetratricopeptide repeat protein [Paludibacteraceae bacterium]